MYDHTWFFGLFPNFVGGVPDAVVNTWISVSEKQVCWAKRCGQFEEALWRQTATNLSRLGYPVSGGSSGSTPVAGSNDYDQVIKKHTVGDVTTEFEVIDKSVKDSAGSSKSAFDFTDELKAMKIRCVGTFTNTHVLRRR